MRKLGLYQVVKAVGALLGISGGVVPGLNLGQGTEQNPVGDFSTFDQGNPGDLQPSKYGRFPNPGQGKRVMSHYSDGDGYSDIIDPEAVLNLQGAAGTDATVSGQSAHEGEGDGLSASRSIPGSEGTNGVVGLGRGGTGLMTNPTVLVGGFQVAQEIASDLSFVPSAGDINEVLGSGPTPSP